MISSGRNHKQPAELLARLKNLKEEVDQSREEATSPCFNEDSIHTLIQEMENSPIKDPPSYSLEHFCRKEANSRWAPGLDETDTIKEINKKLLEDNKALIRECVRLRKIIKQVSNETEILSINTPGHFQITKLQCMNEINKLKAKIEEMKVSQIYQNVPSFTNKQQQSQILATLEELKMSNSQIGIKIQEMKEKDKQKLNNSNTTTITMTHCQDFDRDKVIKNIKIGYQNQIKDLQEEIKVHRNQITRLRRCTSHQYMSPSK